MYQTWTLVCVLWRVASVVVCGRGARQSLIGNWRSPMSLGFA